MDSDGVTIKLPPMAIKSAVEIRVDIVLPNGTLGVTRQLRVTKPASVVLHPTAPKSPLPTQNAIQQIGLQSPPVTTQPVVIAPNVQTPIRPQVGQPIVLPNAPAIPEKSIETNPILQEHLSQPDAEVELNAPQEPPAPSISKGKPVEAISKLIGG